MILKDVIKLLGCDDQVVYILNDNEWYGAFPCCYVPKEIENYKVTAFMPDEFKGESYFNGVVLKIWIEEE